MKQLPTNQILTLLTTLSATHKVYLPLPDSTGQTVFSNWSKISLPSEDAFSSESMKATSNQISALTEISKQNGALIRDALSSEEFLDILQNQLNTTRSPKDLFFPQVENLYDMRINGKQIELIENRDTAEDFVLFGVRACDARSFQLLDRVFLSDPVDTYYQERRTHGVVITLACNRPSETCFCTTFGIDPANPGGDISCFLCGDTLFWQANTEKGEKLTSQLSVLSDVDIPKASDTSTPEDTNTIAPDGIVSNAPELLQQLKEEKDRIHTILQKLPLHSLTTEGFDEEHTLSIWGSDKWASLSESCIGCGTCTFVCPTCQCYDIQELDIGTKVKRYRCWDSCMYSEFTKMSAGQPRPTQRERFRQRFMHKLLYFPTNNDGLYSCVGCGRCLKKCPISMNIVKVIKAFQKTTESK